MKRRILGLILALVMVLGLFPAMALAAERDPSADQVRVIVENTTYPVADGALWDGVLVDTWVNIDQETTMVSAVNAALDEGNVERIISESPFGAYVEMIGGLEQFDGGQESGWMVTLNDWLTNVGISNFTVANGGLQANDVIRFVYTRTGYGADVGGDWDTMDNTSLTALSVNGATLNPAFSSDQTTYTLTPDEGVTSVTIDATAANKHNNVVFRIGETEYRRTAAVPVAENSTIQVVCTGDYGSTVYSLVVPGQTSVTVNATISRAGEVIAAQEPLTVIDVNDDGICSFSEAVTASHENWEYEWEEVEFYLNNVYGSSFEQALADGDFLNIWSYADLEEYTDTYAKFDSFTYTSTGDLTVLLSYLFGQDEDEEDIYLPLNGALITVRDASGNTLSEDDYTVTENGEGSYTIHFTESGTYTLIATGRYPEGQWFPDGGVIIPVTAKAEVTVSPAQTSVTVNATISRAGEVIAAQEPLTVIDVNDDGICSFSEAVTASHENWEYEWEEVEFYLNNVYGSSFEQALADGDFLNIWSYADLEEYTDTYAKFDSFTYTSTGDLTVLLSYLFGQDEDEEDIYLPLNGALITVRDASGNTLSEDDYTVTENGEGSYTIHFTENGTYTLIATGRYPEGQWFPDGGVIIPVTAKAEVIVMPILEAVLEGDTIAVSWNAFSVEEGEVLYVVDYRVGDGAWTSSEPMTGLSYAISDLSVAGTYEVRLCILIDGELFWTSEAVDVTYDPAFAVKADRGKGADVLLDWLSIAGLDTYRVLVSADGGESWTKAGDFTGSNAVLAGLKAGTEYQIMVMALNAQRLPEAFAYTTIRTQFSDVTDETAFYYDPVYWAADNGITTGWADGTFRPWNTCNRASVVTFLWRLAGEPEPQGEFTFSDPTGNEAFDAAITWAVEQGITNGWTSDNTFRPWNTCNRASILTFLWRYAGKPEPAEGYEVAFTDMTGNEDFDAAIAWAASYGIASGYDGGLFKPWGDCNRASTVTFMYRMEQLG